MFLKQFLKSLSVMAAGAAVLVTLSTASQATAPSANWNVDADPGTYSPVVLGEDITLNGCGSTFYNANNPGQSYSLCDLPSLSKFTLRWKASTDGSHWTWITNTYGANSANNGVQVTLATGAGTFFANAGTYYVGLYLTVKNNTNILLPSGSYGYSNSNFDQGNKVTGYSQGFSLTTSTSVPEPAAALLLLPGLALMMRRERRRRAQRAMA